ncbi:hypothetical protein WDU94_004591 [Cyamophila willieti]
MAAKFTSSLGKGQVTIVEPTDTHYYQPMFTLIGGGMKTLSQSRRPMKQVLPSGAEWVKDKIVSFDPDNNRVRTQEGKQIEYEYMIVASGVQMYYERVKGLLEALDDPDSGVSTNYSPHYVEKTLKNLQRFQQGNALYTFPNTPIKCGGAPMKAVLIGDEYLRKHGKRDVAKLTYCTGMGAFFPSPFYAEKIQNILLGRGVELHKNKTLVEVDRAGKEAVFQSGDTTERIRYDIMHVTPPMGPVPELATSPLVDQTGYVTVDKATLQHVKYSNVFAMGDCSNLPTSKTAAAVAAQCKIVYDNLGAVMTHKALPQLYNGYTSCPLVTGYSKCLLAEFDYTLKPLETFPLDQSKERSIMFQLKKEIMPLLYWQLMLRGYWNGPGVFRNMFHLGGIMKQQNRE